MKGKKLNPSYPTKSARSFKENGQENSMMEAAVQPHLNEFSIFELSWAWEPMYKEEAWISGSGKKSLLSVFSRNKARLKEIKHNFDF